ncbi:MAG: hypothetical protein SGPRY_011605, partial [Prymnesium sp.]
LVATAASSLPLRRLLTTGSKHVLRLPVLLGLGILLSTGGLRSRACARSGSRLSTAEKRAALSTMKGMVGKLPSPESLGGENIGTDTYRRFISVCGWDPVCHQPLVPLSLMAVASETADPSRPRHLKRWLLTPMPSEVAETNTLSLP